MIGYLLAFAAGGLVTFLAFDIARVIGKTTPPERGDWYLPPGGSRHFDSGES